MRFGRPALAATVAGAGALATPEDAEASFAGILAKNAPHDMRGMAIKMRQAGVSREEIWRKTGWDLDNPDGRARFEVDDSQGQWDMETGLDGVTHQPRGALSDVLDNPDLYASYPDLADVRATQTTGRGGQYQTNDGFNERVTYSDPSVGRHEVQHAIQEREDFAQGGFPGDNPELTAITRRIEEYSKDPDYDPAVAKDMLAEKMRLISDGEDAVYGMDRAVRTAVEYDRYRRLAGETEARNVQTREDMTPQERRDNPPWETAEFPEDQQIVRMKERGAIDPQLARILGGTAATGAGGALMMGPEIRDTLQGEGLMGALDAGWGALQNAGKFAWDAGSKFGAALTGQDNIVPTVDEYEPMTATGRALRGLGESAFGALLEHEPPLSPTGQSLGADVGQAIDYYTGTARPWLKENAGEYATELGESGAGLLAAVGLPSKTGPGTSRISGRTTINNAERKAYPGIYKTPEELYADVKIQPESENLGRLWGTSRAEMAQTADRPGNQPGVLPGAAANPKGSRAADRITGKANTNRLVESLDYVRGSPLEEGMKGWYVMDPMYQRVLELVGGDTTEALRRYNQLNTVSGMASPGSDVLTEINRGSAANYFQEQGVFDQFLERGGRTTGSPGSLPGVMGHPYHSTAQARPMDDYLSSGQVQLKSPKVPLYMQASGTPETGFQTDSLVGDAHWSRATGLGDVRTNKGYGSSYSMPEAQSLIPWWRDKVAGEAGYEAVPGQAITWGLYGPQTGVTTPVGAPKLELWADEIYRDALDRGISPEYLRDRMLMGEDYIRR